MVTTSYRYMRVLLGNCREETRCELFAWEVMGELPFQAVALVWCEVP
jgi:hypothetical protein